MYNTNQNVKKGENEIIIETSQYNELVTLENIYVIGDFIVEKKGENFIIKEQEKPVKTGDWTKIGYPFYSGKMIYSGEFVLENDNYKKVECHLEQLWGKAFNVKINGENAAVLGWKPYEIDITDYIQDNKNTIEIEVMNSLQNLLGPHNYLEMEGLVTPNSFYSLKQEKFDKSGFGGKAEIVIY